MKTVRDIKRWADLIGGTYARAVIQPYVGLDTWVATDSITLKAASVAWRIADDDLTVISLPLVKEGQGVERANYDDHAALNILLKPFRRDSWHDLEQLGAPLVIFWPEASADFQVKMMTISDSKEDTNRAHGQRLDDPDGIITSWLRGDLTDGMILDWIRDQLH